MKKILITGAESYIGTSVKSWLMQPQFEGRYQIDTVDMRGDEWRQRDFSGYDTVFHVAGLAHADVGKVSDETKQNYYRVNRDLTIETARKARKDGVRQFIFMSSIIVYGRSGNIGEKRVITRETVPAPENFYGDSKLQAENGILPLADESFAVAVLRPPMIYGKGSKGNYPLLAKLACKLPVFPDIENERSMLYIGNLCEYIRQVIDTCRGGVLFPQNNEYVKTTDMVRMIAGAHGKKILTTRMFNWGIILLGKTSGISEQLVNKAFGNLVYEMDMSSNSEVGANYQFYSLEESVKQTEVPEI